MGACVTGLLTAAPAIAATTADSVTATGTGQSKVTPTNRNSNASIKTAYDAAKRAAISGAIADARRNALAYAKAVGLTLGTVLSVSDVQTNGYYGPGEYFGPFGPDQFCGTIRQPIFKRVANKRKVVGTKKVHRCFVPGVAYTTLSLTYSAG
ncbi:MAG: SIMPL domain-containing protein [Solirubrobacteraceae bacterium]